MYFFATKETWNFNGEFTTAAGYFQDWREYYKTENT